MFEWLVLILIGIFLVDVDDFSVLQWNQLIEKKGKYMWLDNASDIDILFYSPYAQLISNITKDKKYNPLTIGVFGLWGAGKSTLLKLISQQLIHEPSIACVNINAWMFEGYEDAKTALMESLLKELYAKKPFEEVKSSIRRLFHRIDLFKLSASLVSVGASVAASVASGNPLPMAMAIPRSATELAATVKNVTDTVQNDKNEYIKDETTVDNIRNFRNDFEEMLKTANINNVVVIVDDLDRCTPEHIIDTLEAIKLFLSVKKTTFIIAADENVIQYAIKKKYPHIDDSDVELSTEYIEKIIQLPIYIPELSSKDIENYLLLLVVQERLSEKDFGALLEKVYQERYIVRDNRIELPEIKKIIAELQLSFIPSETKFMEDAIIIDSIRDIVSSTLKGNPRQAKRFLNTFITKKSLAQMYYGDELDMRILAKLLVLQKLDPDLFVQLNEWNRKFTLCNDEFKEMYDSVLSGSGDDTRFSKWAVPEIKKWLECEPKDLYKSRLDKYFYLTREHLNKKEINIQNFSSQARTILEKIGQSSRGNIGKIIDQMKELEPSDLKDVFSVLLPRIEKSRIDYFIIKELFVGFEPYRNSIIDAIGKAKQKIVLSDAVYLGSMLKVDEKKILPVLDKLKGNGVLDIKMYSQIVGKKR